jgi:hypothetical protein
MVISHFRFRTVLPIYNNFFDAPDKSASPSRDDRNSDTGFASTARISASSPSLQHQMLDFVSSVDGSRIARGKLARWHWSDAVFCPAC